MASFINLPNEILDQIISEVLPADLENFAQTCRRVSGVTKPYLKAHRTLIRKFAILGNTAEDPWGPWGELLHNLVKNPRLGHYVVSLFFRRSSPYPDDQSREQQSFERLLPILPNIKTLTMEDVDISDSKVQLQNAPFTDPPILTNLVNVYVRFPKALVSSFSITQALSALPSLRLLSTQNCGFDHGSHDLLAPMQSHVTRLELWDCHIQSKELHDFLPEFHQLQTFKYSTPFKNETPSGPRPEQDYDPFGIRSGLLHSRSTIQHLTMLAPGRLPSFVGSLVEFESLEEVYISWGLLGPDWGRRDASDLSLVLPTPLRLLRIQSEGGLCAPNSWPLADCMVCGQCAWNYTQLVESVIACKSSQTQNLGELVFLIGEYWDVLRAPYLFLRHALRLLQPRCIDAGIVLTIS